MIEGLHTVSYAPDDQEVERTALAGGAAIQQLISDRDHLRRQTSAQQQEGMVLRTTSDDLRRRLLLVNQGYLELCTEMLCQFERFDGVLREALGDQQEALKNPDETTLIDLAQRLSPLRRASKDGDAGDVRTRRETETVRRPRQY
ncbi:MAG: hypothetical protein E4H01_17315 [Lysobacterales bacterium]|nr:MAG: hypothetical protein E4H01_17315 [Xanthomonadales bacterium]